MPPKKKQETVAQPVQEPSDVNAGAEKQPEDMPPAIPADDVADTGVDNPEVETPDVHDETAGDDEDQVDDEADMVEVAEPCRRCYRHGWPEHAQVEGAHVSCHHGHGIRFGETARITRKLALLCRLIEA